jgi:hypothetical protein
MRVFVVHEPGGSDASHCRELKKHLSVLIQDSEIRFEDHSSVAPGKAWAPEVSKMFEQADIILLLISPDFLASGFCINEQMARAMKRQRDGSARVIPVFLRPCDWQDLEIAAFTPLPSLEKALTRWSDIDFAWSKVAKGIRFAVKELKAAREIKPPDPAPKPVSPTDNVVKPGGTRFDSVRDTIGVRAAYRAISTYQQDLFTIVRQLLDEATPAFGPFKVVAWGSHLFDLPVRRDRNPLEKWAVDYLPLAHSDTWWATEKRPAPGAICVTASHCADNAVHEALERFPGAEPVSSVLHDNTLSTTTLSLYVSITVKLDSKIPITDWNYVDTFIEGAPGYHKDNWLDGTIHEARRVGLIRYFGFKHSMDLLTSNEAVQRLLVAPLLDLINQALRSQDADYQ